MRLVITGVLTALMLSAQTLPPEARAQIEALLQEKASRTPAQKKLDSHLHYAARAEREGKSFAGVRYSTLRRDRGGRVLVDVAGEISGELVDQVAQLGGRVVNSHPEYLSLRAYLPLSAVERLASRSEVLHIKPASRMRTLQRLSEGFYAHAVDIAQLGYGVTGRGVKVGILSDSARAATVASLQAQGDLPAAVTIVPGQDGTADPNDVTLDEGAAMMEIVHDIAPDAQLFFATALGGEAQMAANIQALRNLGCDVIIDDVVYTNESPFTEGGGPIGQAISKVVAIGALYFSAAGNYNSIDAGTAGVWEGDFADSGTKIGKGTAHQWAPGVIGNPMAVTPGNLASGFNALYWSDPRGNSTNDYDLFVLSADLSRVEDSSTNIQNGPGSEPVEEVDFNFWIPGNWYFVVVRNAGAAPRALHLDTFGSLLQYRTIGATFGHNAGISTIGVAAVSAAEKTGPFTSRDQTEVYSSDGPRRVFYDGSGKLYSPGLPPTFASESGLLLAKPDLAAADCVKNAILGPLVYIWQYYFCGTSAAAPHAGAIAALVKSANPSLGGPQILSILKSTALANGQSQRDVGAGIIMADAAVKAALPPINAKLIHEVTLFYERILGREPDQAGLAFWTRSGIVPTSIADSFLVSPEFQGGRLKALLGASVTPASVTNSQFISLLYLTILNRAPDAGGLTYWTAVADRAGLRVYSQYPGVRLAIVAAFVASPEFQSAV